MFLRLKLLLSEADRFLFLLSRSLLWLKLITLISLDVIMIDKLLLVVLGEKLHSSRSIAFVLCTWMSCNTNDADAVEGAERVILELFRDSPRNEVT